MIAPVRELPRPGGLGFARRHALDGIEAIIGKSLIVILVMIAGHVVIKVRGHPGAYQDLPVRIPFGFIRPVGNSAAVGGVTQVAAIDDKLRVDHLAAPGTAQVRFCGGSALSAPMWVSDRIMNQKSRSALG